MGATHAAIAELQVSEEQRAPLILSIETTTRAGSVALARGEEILGSRVGDPRLSHSTHLLRDVEALLTEAGLKPRDVDLFAVASGPGSFTGIRIGVATAKAFAATLEKPAVGIQTLHAVALAAGWSARTMALLPAGRGELFAQMLEVDALRRVDEIEKPIHVAPEKMLERVVWTRRLRWAGEGAQQHAALIREFALAHGIKFFVEAQGGEQKGGEEGWVLAPRFEALAETVATLALRRFLRGETSSPDKLLALYVRPSDAELNEIWLEQTGPSA